MMMMGDSGTAAQRAVPKLQEQHSVTSARPHQNIARSFAKSFAKSFALLRRSYNFDC